MHGGHWEPAARRVPSLLPGRPPTPYRGGAEPRGRAVVLRYEQLGRSVMGTPEREDAGPVQSVDRAVAILEILARDGEAGVTEVARELGVHKSTASRLLAALDRRELVSQDTARGRFRLGVGLVRLAGAAGRSLDVVQESRPVCQALARQVGETVNLAILSGRDALYLDQVAGSPRCWLRLLPCGLRGHLAPGCTCSSKSRWAPGTCMSSVSPRADYESTS